MDRRELQRSMYEINDASVTPRMILAVMAAVWVALAWWLLLGPGLQVAARSLSWIATPGNEARRLCLGAGLSIYYIRILFTEFVFLKRGVSWSEVFTIAPWLLCLVGLLAISGGTNPRPFGAAAGIGVVLFVAGSWMNTYAEYARDVWKRQPEHRGQLYTDGLFRYSRHPNYLGDLVSFSGLSLIAGAWITAIIPLFMLAGFVFVNIPILDSHLLDHYGRAFDEYAQRTRKLVPFVY